MDRYIISIIIIGLAALAMAWVPSLTKRIGISYSIIFLIFGITLYSTLNSLPWPDPMWQEDYAVHLTELIVIIALMGTGLKIDRPFSFRKWGVPFRLVTITMLMCIGSLAIIGIWVLGLDPASAVLLGAILAPTDPVLASDVQVGPPNEGEDDDVRFALTAEAGLNDGMAFPFTWLAIVLVFSGQTGEAWLNGWLLIDVCYRILAGAAMGYGLGRGIVYLFFILPEKYKMLHVRDGFVAISSTLLVYGMTELIHGYGFLAVFVAAITLRNHEMKHVYHRELHRFTDQIERILLAVLLILFGGSLVNGILDNLTWGMALVGMTFILLIRPLFGVISLIGTKLRLREKLAISFFGIRGMGSFFYLSFAFNKAQFSNKEELWALVAFIVLISILIHGLTASFTMKKLNLRYIYDVQKNGNLLPDKFGSTMKRNLSK